MSPALLLAVAAATGAAVMIVELLAVRLLAPWFGQSQIVWTNVIGVVLVALAAGQVLGGRWAEARRGSRPAALLVGAGALCLALPDVVAALAPALLPGDLMLEEALPFVHWGSLLVALLAVGVPMAALGAVTPRLLRLARDVERRPAQAAGRLLAAGTLGGLAGTFGATHVLLPAFGSALSVRLAGGLLVVCGLCVGRLRPARAALLLALPALAAALPGAPPSDAVLAQLETPYQFARVVQADDGARLLTLNEGLDSFHSAHRPGALWTDRYFDAFVAPALWSAPDETGVRSVLVLGLGAGTMARQLLALDPALSVTGVEIDAEIVELGRRFFDLPERTIVRAGWDGRLALTCGRRAWSAILVDAYAQQLYVPAHMATREFFALLRARLAPGGQAAVNLGGRSREEPVVAAIAATFAAEFPDAEIARVPGTRNWILWGSRDGKPDDGARARALAQVGADAQLAWMLAPEAFSSASAHAGRLLVDGDAPVEALAHAAWGGR